uniref:ShKT domain-containing protein n=1 Tax=Corethron hystrix TaxID=216773 RepID=A0A7S1FQ71_9STRA|mmetsp:Transcript_22479/g.51473  ORF Transcript_22479/g.51473 Transcript_22479/m.51473 type:complete len:191 (+) Transcript_22479:172-744(+)
MARSVPPIIETTRKFRRKMRLRSAPLFMSAILLAFPPTSAHVPQKYECLDDHAFHLPRRPDFNCKFIRTRLSLCETTNGTDCLRKACEGRVDRDGTEVGDRCPETCRECEYPHVCVDDPQGLPDVHDVSVRTGAIGVCEWVAREPDVRCNTLSPTEIPLPLRFFCRRTCHECPHLPSAAPTAFPGTRGMS